MSDWEPMFVGHYEHRLHRNRVQIPARWRRGAPAGIAFALLPWQPGRDENRGRATSNSRTRLVALAPERWKAMLERIKSVGSGRELESNALLRWLAGSTTLVELDSLGRLTIPEPMAARAGLSEDIALVGALDKFEIWDAHRFQAELEDQPLQPGDFLL